MLCLPLILNTESVLKRAISNSKLPKVLDFNQSINVNMAEGSNPACTSIPQEINHEDHQFSTGQHPPDTIDFSGDQNFGGDVEGGNSGGLYGTEAVVLTIEFLTDTASKWLLSMLHLGMVLGCIMLGVQLWWKISNDPYTLVYDDTILIINTSVCSFSLAALFLVAFLYSSRVVRNGGKRWTARRKRYYHILWFGWEPRRHLRGAIELADRFDAVHPPHPEEPQLPAW